MSDDRLTTREAAEVLGVPACNALPVLRAGGCGASRVGLGHAGWLLWRRADVEVLATALANARHAIGIVDGTGGAR